MTVVLDANVLLRFADPTAVQHPIAVAALSALRARGESLRTLPQSLYEFWVVATRPIANNGLGLSAAECDQTLTQIEGMFPRLADPPGLFSEWRTLVVANACHGKVAHDARYAAALRAHGLTHFLTFNVPDFTRFPGLTILDPAAVAATAAGPAPPSTTP
jgi:predicted nucleic acid-binding protein